MELLQSIILLERTGADGFFCYFETFFDSSSSAWIFSSFQLNSPVKLWACVNFQLSFFQNSMLLDWNLEIVLAIKCGTLNFNLVCHV